MSCPEPITYKVKTVGPNLKKENTYGDYREALDFAMREKMNFPTYCITLEEWQAGALIYQLEIN